MILFHRPAFHRLSSAVLIAVLLWTLGRLAPLPSAPADPAAHPAAGFFSGTPLVFLIFARDVIP